MRWGLRLRGWKRVSLHEFFILLFFLLSFPPHRSFRSIGFGFWVFRKRLSKEFKIISVNKKSLFSLTWLILSYLLGSWAAAWQSTYGGVIEAGSLFSYLQKLGTLLP